MFDLNSTQKWATGVISDPQATAAIYREALPGWQQSFVQLVLPLTVIAYLIAAVLSLLSDSITAISSPALWAFSLIWALGWSFVIAFIFDVLAGMFDGERNFDAAYAVVALAIIPALIGTAISPLPWIGWLLSLAASIYSLVLAYRFLPVFLAIPQTNRVKHFVLSIIAAIVINIVVTIIIGLPFASSMVEDKAGQISTQDEGNRGGLFGGIERQAELAEAATNDVYDPPANGRLTRDQVAAYTRVKEKTRELQTELDGRLSEKYQDKEPSVSDIFGGIGGMMRMGTAEMEVVKTGGGNWAEHQWVGNQLMTARLQKDLNDTIKHNYELYLEFEDRLKAAE